MAASRRSFKAVTTAGLGYSGGHAGGEPSMAEKAVYSRNLDENMESETRGKFKFFG